MHYLRKSKPSADSPSPEVKTVQKLTSQRDPKTLGATSSAIALSILSAFNDDRGTSNVDTTDQGSVGWQAVYAAVRMVVEVTEKSSDMFLPLKTAVGAVFTLIKNCDVGVSCSQPSHPLTLCLFRIPANS